MSQSIINQHPQAYSVTSINWWDFISHSSLIKLFKYIFKLWNIIKNRDSGCTLLRNSHNLEWVRHYWILKFVYELPKTLNLWHAWRGKGHKNNDFWGCDRVQFNIFLFICFQFFAVVYQMWDGSLLFYGGWWILFFMLY